MGKGSFFSAKRITGLAVLLALVIVLQLVGSYIKIGATSFSFVLVPIVIAGLMYGVIAGAILGFAFGLVVLLQGISGVDGFTMILFEDHPFFTTLLCLGKGTAAGVVSALLYKFIAPKNEYVGVFAAAIAAPVVNTGLFILGSLAFLQDSMIGAGFTDADSMMYFLIVTCAGVNFLVELAINLIAAPSVYRVTGILKGRRKTFLEDEEDTVSELNAVSSERKDELE